MNERTSQLQKRTPDIFSLERDYNLSTYLLNILLSPHVYIL